MRGPRWCLAVVVGWVLAGPGCSNENAACKRLAEKTLADDERWAGVPGAKDAEEREKNEYEDCKGQPTERVACRLRETDEARYDLCLRVPKEEDIDRIIEARRSLERQWPRHPRYPTCDYLFDNEGSGGSPVRTLALSASVVGIVGAVELRFIGTVRVARADEDTPWRCVEAGQVLGDVAMDSDDLCAGIEHICGGSDVRLPAGGTRSPPFTDPASRRIYCLDAADQVRGTIAGHVELALGHGDRRVMYEMARNCTEPDTLLHDDTPIATALDRAYELATDGRVAEATRIFGHVADVMAEYARTGRTR